MNVRRFCSVALSCVLLFSNTTVQATYYYCMAKDGSYHSLYITEVISIPDRFTTFDIETCMDESFGHDFTCLGDANRSTAVDSRQLTLEVYRDWNVMKPIDTRAMDCPD